VKQTKKKYLMQARLYRLMSTLFVMAGLLIFIIMYLKNVEGRLLEALRDPYTVIMVFFPFAPAVVLSFLAKSSENKYLDLHNQETKSQK
jgi:uncharacterized membrane protein